MQGQLPRYTVATACYGEEPKSTSAMYFAEKLRINLLFPDQGGTGIEKKDPGSIFFFSGLWVD